LESIAALSKTRSNPIKNSKNTKTLPPRPPYLACAGTRKQCWPAPCKCAVYAKQQENVMIRKFKAMVVAALIAAAAVPFISAPSHAASYAAEQNYWHVHDDKGW
jgi:hypothetical protein